MKSFGAHRGLLIATVSLLCLPLLSVAQEGTQPSPQQRYVSDKLVLNVYAEADQGSARVATIQTGDGVEELERVGNLVHVRLDDGREGWVGANYLTSDPPAVIQLRELQRQQKPTAPVVDKKLIDEIAQLKKEKAALQAKVTELQSRPIAPIAPPAEVSAPVSNTPTNGSPETALPVAAAGSGMSPVWPVALVLTAALSFVGGYQTLSRRINKKFGGLRII